MKLTARIYEGFLELDWLILVLHGLYFKIFMWALRRTARHLRVPRGNGKGTLRAFANLLEKSKCNAVQESNRVNGEGFVQGGHIIARSISYGAYSVLVQVGCGFTSLAGEKKEENKIEGNDDDSGFSELDVALEEDTLGSQSHLAEEAMGSESEVSEGKEDQADPHLSEAEDKEKTVKLTEAIFECSYLSVPARLDKWVEEGNILTREDVHIIIKNLRKRQMIGRALQVYQWLLAKSLFPFNENEHSICLELVAREHGISKAQEYFETIPLKMRVKKVYGKLLSKCVYEGDIKKSEEIFKKMKDAGLSPGVIEYNSLLILYKHINRKNVFSILKMMEHENVKPNSLTYNILIDCKGRAGNIVGMEQVFNKMKEDGIETDYITLSTLAKHYVHFRNLKKVELLIKELENSYMNERHVLKILLPLYADVGKDNEIERVWNIFESSHTIFMSEYIAGIKAWGKLGNIEKAEVIFEKLLNSGKKIKSPRAYKSLLDVYANHNLSLKGMELVERMFSKGITIDPATCDTLVKLFVKSGDTEKAGAFLFEVCRGKQVKPWYKTFSRVLEEYAERGDIENSEKIFDGLTCIGYSGQLQSYEFLLQAYIKAQIPAYGFKERMLAANLYPTRRIDNLLQKVEALKEDGFKNHISDILD
ncbi:hypothetical protein SUGI_0084610 [Cryptomeria japonica]|nr:hypothetical protein SUGI_0084610 [Cryptomeria japonica]